MEAGAGDIGAITITLETGTAKESGTTVETRFVDTVWTPTLQIYSAERVLDVLPKLVNNMVRMNRSSKLQGEVVEGWEMGNEDRCMYQLYNSQDFTSQNKMMSSLDLMNTWRSVNTCSTSLLCQLPR